MAIPKCKLNVWSTEFQEFVAEEHGIRTSYVGKTCSNKDFNSAKAILELIGDKEKKFNIKTVG